MSNRLIVDVAREIHFLSLIVPFGLAAPVLEMNMGDPVSIGVEHRYDVAAPFGDLTGIRCEPDQRRIGEPQDGIDLLAGFDGGTGMRMQRRHEPDLLAIGADPV